MKIVTSYFARLKSVEQAGFVPVAICQYPPKWYSGLIYKKLAPSYWCMRGMKCEESRAEACEEFLKSLPAKEEVLQDLTVLSGGKNVALLCFERPSDFCHRKLVAAWLGLGKEHEFSREV